MPDRSTYSNDRELRLPMPLPPDSGPLDERRWRVGVETKHYPSGLIEQTIDLAGIQTRRVMDTAETHIRDALIALGWTPPPEQKD